MKKEITTKAISVFLAIVFVLLTPGMYIGAADAERKETNPFNEDIVWDEVPESEIEGIVPLEADSSFKERVEAAKTAGTLVPFDTNDTSNAERINTVMAHSSELKTRLDNLRSSSGYVNTAAYLRFERPVFSATTANVSSVSLSSGSLNVGYPLASFTGRGGIEASIQLIYDSSSSETKEKHWENVPSNEYFAKKGDFILRYTPEYVFEEFYDNYEEFIFSSESEYLAFMSNNNYPDLPDYMGTIGNDGYTYEIYYDVILDSGNINYPVEDVRDKTLSSAEIGLAPGWRFNIPVIEKQQYLQRKYEAKPE